MAIKQPHRIIDNILENYINKDGEWYNNQFHYTSWMTIADRLIANHQYDEGYLLKGLVSHIFGYHEDAKNAALLLMNYAFNNQSVTLYIISLYNGGQTRLAYQEFNRLFNGVSLSDYSINDLLIKFALAQVLLDTEAIKYMVDEIANTPSLMIDDKILVTASKFLSQSEANTKAVDYARINKDMVIDVLAIAIEQFYAKVNGLLGIEMEINSPNDDLVVTIFSEQINKDNMLELNEAWLERMLDYEGEYDFTDLSRVLVNYRPATGAFGGYDASKY